MIVTTWLVYTQPVESVAFACLHVWLVGRNTHAYKDMRTYVHTHTHTHTHTLSLSLSFFLSFFLLQADKPERAIRSVADEIDNDIDALLEEFDIKPRDK